MNKAFLLYIAGAGSDFPLYGTGAQNSPFKCQSMFRELILPQDLKAPKKSGEGQVGRISLWAVPAGKTVLCNNKRVLKPLSSGVHFFFLYLRYVPISFDFGLVDPP